MIIPLGFGQANFIFTGSAVPTGAQVTLGFEHTGSDLNAAEAAGVLASLWVGTFLTRQVDSIILSQVHIKYGPNDIGAEGDNFPEIAGTSAGDEHAPQVSLLIKKHSGQGGRFARGRMYVPGLNESVVDTGGVLDTSELIAWQDEADSFYDGMITEGLTPMVLHAEGSPALVPTEVIAFIVDGKCASQRRRNRR